MVSLSILDSLQKAPQILACAEDLVTFVRQRYTHAMWHVLRNEQITQRQPQYHAHVRLDAVIDELAEENDNVAELQEILFKCAEQDSDFLLLQGLSAKEIQERLRLKPTTLRSQKCRYYQRVMQEIKDASQ